MVTIRTSDLRARARAALAGAGFDDPRTEADVLVAAVLGRTRGELELDALLDRPVPAAAAATVESAVRRRRRREPLQHVVGRAPFRDVELHVGPGVFTPRPETEGLVQRAVDVLGDRGGAPLRVVDLGAGSGAVGIGLARALPNAEVWCVEASPNAWPWLVHNAREFGEGRVRPVFGLMTEVALPGADGRLDAVVTNPPYVPRANAPRDPEVRLFDPDRALYGGHDGLDLVRRLVAWSAGVLVPGGLVAIEHDDHQGPDVRALLGAAGVEGATTDVDLAGRDRVTWGRLGVAHDDDAGRARSGAR